MGAGRHPQQPLLPVDCRLRCVASDRGGFTGLPAAAPPYPLQRGHGAGHPGPVHQEPPLHSALRHLAEFATGPRTGRGLLLAASAQRAGSALARSTARLADRSAGRGHALGRPATGTLSTFPQCLSLPHRRGQLPGGGNESRRGEPPRRQAFRLLQLGRLRRLANRGTLAGLHRRPRGHGVRRKNLPAVPAGVGHAERMGGRGLGLGR